MLWVFECLSELRESAWVVFRHRHITFDDRIANRTGKYCRVIEMALRVFAVTDESCPLEDQSPPRTVGRLKRVGIPSISIVQFTVFRNADVAPGTWKTGCPFSFGTCFGGRWSATITSTISGVFSPPRVNRWMGVVVLE